MIIEIDTQGFAESTFVKFNGVEQKTLTELNFSISSERGSRGAKMQTLKWNPYEKRMEPNNFFGGDFEKFDNSDVKPKEFIGGNANKKETDK